MMVVMMMMTIDFAAGHAALNARFISETVFSTE